VSHDPVGDLAVDELRGIAADIEFQLTERSRPGTRPVLVILHMARLEAARALMKLVTVNPHDSYAVQDLQNQVRRFEDLVRWTLTITQQGAEIEQAINDGDADVIATLIDPTPEQEAEFHRLGINGEADE
jgi:hypothetical protein